MYTSAFASALEFARKPNRGPGAALDNRPHLVHDLVCQGGPVSFKLKNWWLLTGMYGMNFQQKDGEPGIPELMFAYPWGYVWFWCCFLTCSLSMVAYFKYYRRWI